MAFCTACGQPRNGAGRFCTGCGTPFEDVPDPGDAGAGEQSPELDEAFGGLFAPRRDNPATGNDTARLPPITGGGGGPGGSPGGSPGGFPGGGPVGGPGGPPGGPGGGWSGPGWQSGPGNDWIGRPPSGRSSRSKIIAAIAGAVIVVAAGGAVLGFEMHGQHGSPGSAAKSPASGTPSPSRSAGTPDAVVAVAPRVARNPDTGPIVRLLTSYFTAINSHDFSAYQTLLDPQMRRSVTLSRFAAGYRSTTDSAATLTGISRARDGRTVATVTFTSHQDPSDSPDHSPCTIWVIELFLEPSNGGFLIGPAQPGYHSSHRSCNG